jgi:Spy/CpxP family protein refolding chaperone
MRRFSPLGMPTSVLMVALLVGPLAAGGPSQEAQQAAQPTPPEPGITYLSLPGLWELWTENVQQELELTDEQNEKLIAIGREYYQQTRRDWAELRGISAEERKPKDAEIRQKNLKRRQQIRNQVEQVLSPDQMQHLKQINLRIHITAALAEPRVLDRLAVTEPQKKRLRQIRQQMQERIRKLQQESLEKTLDVLTPEQRKQLAELTTEGSGIFAAGQVPSPP